jgi:membrane fusion protein, macrolide-specific efflux system
MSEAPDISKITPDKPRHRMPRSFSLPAPGVRRAGRAMGTPLEASRLRIVLLVALAISLIVAGVSLAVLPSQIRAASAKVAASPTGSRVIAAAVGTVSQKLVLDGLVVRQADEQIRVPANGTITSVSVERGDEVTAGTNLAVLTLSAPPVTIPSPSPSSSPNPTPTASATATPTLSPTPAFTFVPPVAPEVRQIAAPIDGVVKDISVVLGQYVKSGRIVIVLAPSQFDVIAPVAPSMLYQFFTPPLGISATIKRGPAPFDCAFTSIGDNLTVDGASTLLTEAVDLRCVVPKNVDVFSGIRVQLEVTTAEVANVVVLPLRAIQVHGTQGLVWVVEKGHRPVRKTVQLGINDGRQVQIVSGLHAGERVVDPAPKA